MQAMPGADGARREGGQYKLWLSSLPANKERCRTIVQQCANYVSYTLLYTKDVHCAMIRFETRMDALMAWDVLANMRVKPTRCAREARVQVRWA